MESSKSPRQIFNLAYEMAKKVLPAYSSKFSRKDFTLPQLYACLILKSFFDTSYRGIEAFLRDAPEWCADIGLRRVPDHNTICEAFAVLTTLQKTNGMLDKMAEEFEARGLLNLHGKPLCADSTHFEKHVVSRHFERRKNKGLTTKTTQQKKSESARTLPKLGLCVAAGCHAILSLWTGTGMGSDSPHLWPLAGDALRRTNVKIIAADAGYDGERNLEMLRSMGLTAVIPPRCHALIGGPLTPLRAQMWREFRSGAVAEIYAQRWQIETVNSMLKRNYGSALRSRSAQLREQEMMLKASLHNLALLWPINPQRV
jgi:hypothetical protein